MPFVNCASLIYWIVINLEIDSPHKTLHPIELESSQSIKWHISTPDQMTCFDARPNDTFRQQTKQNTSKTNDVLRPPTKWHISTPNQMTYFDAPPNYIFCHPTKWYITIPDQIDAGHMSNPTKWHILTSTQTKWYISMPHQMIYLDAWPNHIFGWPIKWYISMPNEMVFSDTQSNDLIWSPTKRHISTPDQMTYFRSLTKWYTSQLCSNDIFRRPTTWYIFEVRPNDIIRRPTKWYKIWYVLDCS